MTVEGLDAYKGILDNLKYLNKFLDIYPKYTEYVNIPRKYPMKSKPHYARALTSMEILDEDLEKLIAESKSFTAYLKFENLNTILELEEDLELIYVNLCNRFAKIFNAISLLGEDVEFLKKVEMKEKKLADNS